MSTIQQMLLAKTVSGGGSTSLDTQTVTTGATGTAPDRNRGYLAASFGSVADGTSDLYGGAVVRALYWSEGGGIGSDSIIFRLAGTLSNSGWTQLTINSTVLMRSAASFGASGGNTTWTWDSLGLTVGSQPFGGAGASFAAVFS